MDLVIGPDGTIDPAGSLKWKPKTDHEVQSIPELGPDRIIHQSAKIYNRRGMYSDYTNQFIRWDNNESVTHLGDYIIAVTVYPNFKSELRTTRWFKTFSVSSFIEVTNQCDYERTQNHSFCNVKTDPGIGHELGLFYELNVYLPKPPRIPTHKETGCPCQGTGSYNCVNNKPSGKSSQTYYCMKPWEAKHIAGIDYIKCNEFRALLGIANITSNDVRYDETSGVYHKFVISGQPNAVDSVMIKMNEWLERLDRKGY